MFFVINDEGWTVKWVDAKDPSLVRSDGSKTVGVTDTESRTVSIATGLIPSFEKKVLCHEIVHCAMFSYGVDLTIEQEEIVADLISTYGEEIINITNDVFGRIKKRVA
ncbi:MAG: hypothetical protein MJ091_06125 [Clostridia bacterium]|nr:hypothetical protein [Clostridia bacterium]